MFYAVNGLGVGVCLCVLSGRLGRFGLRHDGLYFGGIYFRLGRFAGREVHGVYGSGGAYGFALAAQAAFLIVDVGNVVGHGNGVERTFFGTLATADAGSRAGLAGDGSFVFVDAAYIHAARFRPFVAQLDDAFGTGFHTGTASGTQCFVDFGQTCLGIDAYGSESAGVFTIAIAQAAIGAARFTAVQRSFDGAGFGAVVVAGLFAVGTSAVAAYDSNFGSYLSGLFPQYGGDFGHDGSSTYGAQHTVERVGFHTRGGETSTAGVSAASAVGSG